MHSFAYKSDESTNLPNFDFSALRFEEEKVKNNTMAAADVDVKVRRKVDFPELIPVLCNIYIPPSIEGGPVHVQKVLKLPPCYY